MSVEVLEVLARLLRSISRPAITGATPTANPIPLATYSGLMRANVASIFQLKKVSSTEFMFPKGVKTHAGRRAM